MCYYAIALHTFCITTDHEGHPDVARHRGSLNDDAASSNWSSPYAERNVSHSVAYTSSGKGRIALSRDERLLLIVANTKQIPLQLHKLCVSVRPSVFIFLKNGSLASHPLFMVSRNSSSYTWSCFLCLCDEVLWHLYTKFCGNYMTCLWQSSADWFSHTKWKSICCVFCWMRKEFLLLPALPGSPRQRAVKWLQ